MSGAPEVSGAIPYHVARMLFLSGFTPLGGAFVDAVRATIGRPDLQIVQLERGAEIVAGDLHLVVLPEEGTFTLDWTHDTSSAPLFHGAPEDLGRDVEYPGDRHDQRAVVGLVEVGKELFARMNLTFAAAIHEGRASIIGAVANPLAERTPISPDRLRNFSFKTVWDSTGCGYTTLNADDIHVYEAAIIASAPSASAPDAVSSCIEWLAQKIALSPHRATGTKEKLRAEFCSFVQPISGKGFLHAWKMATKGTGWGASGRPRKSIP